MNGESSPKFLRTIARLFGNKQGEPNLSEKRRSSLSSPEPLAHVQAAEKMGAITEKNLEKWLRFLLHNNIYASAEIARSFADEVLGGQNATLSLEEIGIFYSKLSYLLDDKEKTEEIYQILVVRDVIRFSIGPIDGKTLELWLKKNSGGRSALETAMITEAFIAEVLRNKPAILSIPEMEVLHSRLKVVFGSRTAEKVYAELRFRQILLFKAEV